MRGKPSSRAGPPAAGGAAGAAPRGAAVVRERWSCPGAVASGERPAPGSPPFLTKGDRRGRVAARGQAAGLGTGRAEACLPPDTSAEQRML